jgi:hypothetical protein
MDHLVMFVIFHVHVITYQNFNYHTFITFLLKKFIFWNENVFKLMTWYSNMIKII